MRKTDVSGGTYSRTMWFRGDYNGIKGKGCLLKSSYNTLEIYKIVKKDMLP